MTATTKANVLDQLTEGIEQLTSSERWQDWLDMQSRFHRYSFNNTLLILRQRPDATRVAGFNAWRQLNRFVRKGEKGIWILAPMVYKTDADQAAAGEEPTKVIRGFKPVPVFDLSQTDGEDLPEICTRLTGDQPGDVYGNLLTVAQGIGFSVEHTELDSEINGDCNHLTKCIRIEARNDQCQQLKTLAHELGHAILHEPGEGRPESRTLLELEAESVAYVVCQNLGIESSDYSFGYVASWVGGSTEARDAIKASGSRIQRAADQILTAIEAVQDLGREEVA
ncbi:MAG: ArdC-like ssDNA-binding domain-containing protein [Acidimicrobiales bacterium]